MSVLHITKDTFQSEVLEAKEPVIVDFWATWCGPCRMLAPVLEEIAQERSDVKVCKVNVDEQGELAMQFQIASIPTLLIFKDGKLMNQSVGVVPKAKILGML